VKPVLPDLQSEVRLSRSQRRRPGRAGTESVSQCYLYESALALELSRTSISFWHRPYFSIAIPEKIPDIRGPAGVPLERSEVRVIRSDEVRRPSHRAVANTAAGRASFNQS